MLVGAVLTPQRADDTELSEGGSTAEHADESVVFVTSQSVLANELGGDFRIARPRFYAGHLRRQRVKGWTRRTRGHRSTQEGRRARAQGVASSQ